MINNRAQQDLRSRRLFVYVISAVIIFALMYVWLGRIRALHAEVEPFVVSANIRMLRLAVVFESSRILADQGAKGLEPYIASNPMVWLDWQHASMDGFRYEGEIDALAVLEMPTSSWAFDRQRKQLVYRSQKGQFSCWQVVPWFKDFNGNGRYDPSIESLSGLSLEPVGR